ncbi:hypothetical protein A2V49_04725 [candidate division WWE3 bacterium RBG_19FT_COMBO_34_6]|uniref:HhH-GPD domain-containing protein n=1 Tax=candidate division WWE3 bacterium RBG_19FT_COMBO_34_6 TaxID=1802612 RepID=A0A1F4UJM0_UNCKA|nr:MAG: hypothetical protein A2V49_04725 [candidate division WWE3 bacterium RBG_19FT_COMBO_34_6]
MAKIDKERLYNIANVIAKRPSLKPFDFAEGEYPSIDNNIYHVLHYFFFWVLMEWGFWYLKGNKYEQPLYGSLDGKKLKGDNLLTALLSKKFLSDPYFFNLEHQTFMSWDTFVEMFSDDNGPVTNLASLKRYNMMNAMSLWFLNHNTPEQLLSEVNRRSRPLKEFRKVTKKIPGFDKDPLEKRSLLLAMVLNNRPEKFLRISDGEELPAIVDYHLMRMVLRTGIVLPNSLERYFLERRLLIPNVMIFFGEGIRRKTYDAVNLLPSLSDRDMSTIDYALWEGRRYCPEMQKPDCAECIFDSVCAKEVDLFQPVYITDFF